MGAERSTCDLGCIIEGCLSVSFGADLDFGRCGLLHSLFFFFFCHGIMSIHVCFSYKSICLSLMVLATHAYIEFQLRILHILMILSVATSITRPAVLTLQ